MSKFTKTFLVIVTSILLIVILIALVKNKSQKYDVSMMNSVTVKDVLDMFDSKKTYVLFVGRKSCDVCIDILPALQESQIKNNYITQYLDIEKVDRNSDDWYELVSRLTMKSTQTLTEDGSGKEVTETYGYFLHNYGFTPTIVIIKEGKQSGGSIGGSDHKILVDWLTNKIK